MAVNESVNQSKAQNTTEKVNLSNTKLYGYLQLLGIVLITAAIILFTILAWESELEKESKQISAEFHEIGAAYINQITSQIDVTMEILPTTSLYSKIAGGLSQDSFFEFSRDLFDRYSAIGSLGWAPLVERQNIEKVEFDRINEGYPGYKVYVSNQQHLPYNEIHTPVTYMEFSRGHDFRPDDLSWMGLDLISHEPWKQSMDSAVQNNKISFSLGLNAPINVIAFFPVYLPNSETTTQEERRKNLAGYLIAQLDPQRALELAGKTGMQPLNEMIAMRLFDISQSQSPLPLAEQIDANILEDSNLDYQQVVSVYGRDWRFELSPTTKFIQSVETDNSANWILGGGLLVALLTLFSLVSQATRSKKIQVEVKQRTEELVNVHNQLRESEAMLMHSEKMSSLGQMVAGVAHELNTPLGYVRSNLELIQEHFGDLKYKFSHVIQNQEKRNIRDKKGVVQHLFEKINDDVNPETMTEVCQDSLQGVDHLSSIVTTLKSFSRMDKVNFEENSIPECMESSLLIAHNHYKNKVEIVKSFENVPNVLCNASEINQVFLNLILNAADAIEEFGIININISEVDKGVMISIIDTGEGIPDEIRKKIFEPFYTTKDVGKGTGLGLFICNRIIASHNGTIEVFSSKGQGTEFRIFLPFKPIAKAV